MNIAVIPTFQHLALSQTTKHHLILTHLLYNDAYRNFYTEKATNGDFVILDNSAHEQTRGQDADILLRSALKVHPQEIVCPDVLFDAKGTVDGFQRALKYFTGDGSIAFKRLRPRLMVVPQGICSRDWRWCYENLTRVYLKYRSHLDDLGFRGLTLGLSKDYETFSGGLMQLLEDFLLPGQEIGRFNIHLLGWGRQLWEIEEIATRYRSRIRSIDSAKPIVFAMNGIRLRDFRGREVKYPRRSKTYFQDTLTSPQLEIAEDNIELFRELAEGV